MKSITNLLEIFEKHPIISTDTRKIIPSSIFFALKGGNFNGNNFAEEALLKGAAFVVVDDPELKEKHPDDSRFLFVNDALKALQNLAHDYRKSLDVQVLAIGGSNGKTTTKELLKAVLSTQFITHATPGNLNNHIGLPLTLLGMPKNTELAIIELGTNQKGDIQELVEIACPDYGLITNIGKEHLEGFGSMEGVAREESELFLYLLRHGGLAFVNVDDEWLLSMSKRLNRSVTYGADPQALYSAELLNSLPGMRLRMENGLEVNTQLPGAYNFSNVLAAFAVGRYFGIDDLKIKEAVEGYVSQNSRSQYLQKSGYTFLLDCYNANPSSMELALKSLTEHEGKVFFILGDMLELGTFEDAEHDAIIALVHQLGLKEGIFIGPVFSRRLSSDSLCFPDSQQAAEYLKANPPAPGALVFLKGSRGIAVEKAIAHWL